MRHICSMTLQSGGKRARWHARSSIASHPVVGEGLKHLLVENFKLVGMRRICSTAGIICCLLASLECPKALADKPLPRSVLVIDQFELASPGSAAVLSSFRSTLRNNSTSPISVYIENLDLGRFGGSRFKDVVQAYFREKYQDRPIDVIVPIGSAALELVLYLRLQLWADTPVIFAAVDEGVPDRLILPAKVTGTTMPAPLTDSVSVARAIVPAVRRIAIVGDPPERQFIRRKVQEQLELLATEFELIDLTRLRMLTRQDDSETRIKPGFGGCLTRKRSATSMIVCA